MGNAIPLTAHEALSGVFGTISLVAWIVVFIPQLIENYRLQSGEGVSLAFLLVWFVGDVTNMAGAIWADLVPTVVALAVYFCFADVVLLTQCLYYNWKNARLERKAAKRDVSRGAAEVSESNEEQPLLGRRESTQSQSSIGLPGSHKRRKSSAASRMSARSRTDSLSKILEDPASNTSSPAREWAKNIIGVALVFIIGAAAWAIAWKSGMWKPAPPPEDTGEGGLNPHDQSSPIGAQILGYISAVAYLGARIPQIIKNWRIKSTEGLSLLFFILSLIGNLTYGAGILCHSLNHQYVVKNVPWLVGSLGTMFEDVIIFWQFQLYKNKVEAEAIT